MPKPLTDKQIDEVTKYWREGVSTLAICEMVGIDSPRYFDHLRTTVLSHLEPRAAGHNGGRPKTLKDPTPSEIAVRAAQVRSRWTPEERASRRCGDIFHGRISLQEERSATLPDPTEPR